MSEDRPSQAGADHWSEVIARLNAEPSLAARCLCYVRCNIDIAAPGADVALGVPCLNHVGRDILLKITPRALEMHLAALVTRVERYREREIAVKMAAKAKGLLRELRRAREGEEGLSNCDAGVDLNRLSENLERLANPKKPALRTPNWRSFIARDIGEAYAMAFDRKPAKSQTKGSNNIARAGGPFVRFAHFIISIAPYVTVDNGLEIGTIARYVGKERETIDRIWARHEKLRILTT
jgi:hypothetical protein